jgi:flagellar basal-body rod modification protein FlgD
MEAKDVSEFINNTVKLREMEVLNSFESSVKALDSANTSNALLMASNLIHKQIRYEGNETYVKNGKSNIEFSLKDNADIVEVSIVDKNGNVVESKKFTNLEAGKEYPFEIDNSSLRDGYYKVYINAQKDGHSVDITTYSRALVDGVIRKDDQIKVLFGSKELEIEKILQIGG